jgi:hypothetical protein
LLRKSSVAGIAVLNFLMLCPALVAIGLQQFVYREPIAQPLALLSRPTRWFLVAWVLPPVVMLAALGVSLLLPTAIYPGTRVVCHPRWPPSNSRSWASE